MRATVLAALVICGSACLGVHAAADSSGRSRVSEIIYPRSASALRMKHGTPGHRALACTACHSQSRGSAQPRDGLRPREASCVPCHAKSVDRAQQSTQACAGCDAGFDAQTAPAIVPARPPRARLHFSHARHAKVSGGCVGCHGDTQAQEPSMPSMRLCLDCHRGSRELACDRCHLTTASGRLRTTFEQGKLVPRGPLLGIAHDADFSVRHRWLAADHGGVCASCHVEDDCTECHDGRVRPRGIHPNDYLSLHAQDAQRSSTRCTSCHTTQSFCLPCHARLGVSTLSAPELASPRRFHPSSGQWLRGPMGHGRQAERSLESCVSCHAERDCVVCHGARTTGGAGVSPHPPGFASSCGARLAQNPRPCVACHGDSAALRLRCR